MKARVCSRGNRINTWYRPAYITGASSSLDTTLQSLKVTQQVVVAKIYRQFPGFDLKSLIVLNMGFIPVVPMSLDGVSLNGSSIIMGMLAIAIAGVVYVIGTAIYNIYFHPLASYPGPKLWAATSIPYAYYWRSGRFPFKVAEFHATYGQVVRILPDELSYSTEDAWKEIYAQRQGHLPFLKDPRWYVPAYDPPLDHVGHIIAPNPEEHARFRRLLSHGFSAKSLQAQEVLIMQFVNLLVSRCHENCAKPLDLSKWYNFCTFDIIGDLLFGESFGCLDHSDYHPWVRTVFLQIKASAFMVAINRFPNARSQWFRRIAVPHYLREKRRENKDLVSVRVQKRLDRTDDRPDLLSHALSYTGDPKGMTRMELEANANILIGAGSETTATTLSAASYLICSHPAVKQKLIDEVRGTFTRDEDINFIDASNLKYMLAVLNEALRLFPIVPVGLPRIVPKGGETVNGKWVPAGTAVSVQPMAATRSPENFHDPLSFRPERWLGDEKFANDKLGASQPFSIGSRNCLGRNLAFAEMRTIFAKMVWHFDMELQDDSLDWMDQNVWTLWDRKPLNVRLTPVVRS